MLTKNDLVEQAAASVARALGPGPGVSRRDCYRIVDAFLEAVKRGLKRDGGIELRNFGTFKVKRRAARTARNPRTGAPVPVAARGVAVFKPSKELRTLVANAKPE